MKIRSVIFVLAFLLVSPVLFAQTYTFKVLVSKGKTEVKAADSWQTIKVGASLKPNDEVKIGENAYLGLIHANGKPLEVREAKTYKVSDLVSKMTPGTSVLNKYTDFILSSQEQKKNRLTATGAVHRDVVLVPKDVVIVFLPESEQSQLYGDHATIQWATSNVKGPYEVIFTSLMGEELAKLETKEAFVSVPLDGEKFKNEAQIMVKVVAKEKRGAGSKDYIIKRLRPAERKKVDSLMNQVVNMDPKSALTKYIMAGFYEENLLLIDALTAYQEAVALAPDVELYKTEYEEFLKRMEFKK
jgi:hypothetical protein